MSERSAFWQFSLRLYAADGIAEACLALQNKHGADVNVLLYCCWVGGTLGQMSPSQLDAIRQFSVTWNREVVTPLRQVRTWLKQSSPDRPLVSEDETEIIREKVKRLELHSEMIQQRAMERLTQTFRDGDYEAEPGDQSIRRNLAAYGTALGLTGSATRDSFNCLSAAAEELSRLND